MDAINLPGLSDPKLDWRVTRSPGSPALTVVPEPATLVLPAIGGVAVLRRRRRETGRAFSLAGPHAA